MLGTQGMTRSMDSKTWRSRIVALGALFLALLIAGLFIWIRSRSECWSESACPSGQKCMELSTHYASGVNWFFPVRVCRIPCSDDRDCPAGYGCWLVDQGPGGDAVCIKAP